MVVVAVAVLEVVGVVAVVGLDVVVVVVVVVVVGGGGGGVRSNTIRA